jgi:hypothetical protein
VKTLINLVLAGALLGIFVASVVVPPALSWYTTPGGLPEGAQIQALVEIPEVIRYSTGRLLRWQAIGAAIGAVAGLAGGIFLMRRRRVKAHVPSPGYRQEPEASADVQKPAAK